MAKFEVVRHFPSYRRGQVMDLPEDHRRTAQLVRTGYIKQVAESTPVTVAEEVIEEPTEQKTVRRKKKHGSN